MKIEGAYPIVWIRGEISNLSRLSTNHLYFTLKEAGSEISAVMFAKANRRLRFTPADGAEVLACGRPTLWVPRGRYQFVVEEMEPRGRGSLLQAFEALKQRLLAYVREVGGELGLQAPEERESKMKSRSHVPSDGREVEVTP